jgi:hypothetical protein
MRSRVSESHIGWLVRIALGAELLFGLLGASALVLAPEHTDTNFAWALKPAPMAATLGAFYLASAGMLIAGLFARYWEEVRALVVPAAIVTGAALLNTFLHWDRFAHGTPAFAAWFISYLLPPPVFLVLFWWRQRHAQPFGTGEGRITPRWFRDLCLFNGGALGTAAIVLIVAPQLVLARGPWALTPLSLRIVSGWLLGLAVLLVFIGYERSWQRTRIASLWPLLIGPVLMIQLARLADQVTWTNPLLLLVLLEFLVLTLATAWLWIRQAMQAHVDRLASVAIVCVGLFLAVLVALPLLRPELDVWQRWVGEYARGPYGGLMIAAYVALGVGVEALAVGLIRTGAGRLGACTLAIAGLGAFMSAILLQDPTDGSPATLAGTVRTVLLMPTFLALSVALIALSRAFGRDIRWRPIAPAALALAVAVPLVFVVVIVAPPDWKGMAGRVFDAVWTSWLLLAALRLRGITRPACDAHTVGSRAVGLSEA